MIILTEWDEFSNKENSNPPLSPPRSDTSIDAEDSAVEVANKTNRSSTLQRPCTETSPKAALLDWLRVMELMQKPALVFDGRRIVDVEKLQQLGFHVESIGKGNIA